MVRARILRHSQDQELCHNSRQSPVGRPGLWNRQVMAQVGMSFGVHGTAADKHEAGCKATAQLGAIVMLTVSAPSTTTVVAVAKLEPPYHVSG